MQDEDCVRHLDLAEETLADLGLPVASQNQGAEEDRGDQIFATA
jgi:hypothetical protein